MHTRGSKKLVLIVEDDAHLAAAWKTSLTNIGFDVIVCSQIEAGVKICEQRWPDVIVLDGFFLDEKGIPKCEGAVSFCSSIESFAAAGRARLPAIIGVTGVRPSEDFQMDVFSPISLEVMPTRMRKPFEPGALVYEVERVFA